MQYGIYLIEINGKKYVGSSMHLKERISQHKSDLKNQRHKNPILQNYYNKYGNMIIKVLYAFDYMSEYYLRKLEKYVMEREKCYFNIQDPMTNFSCKKIYQFTLEGKFIREYESAREASIIIGASYSSISHACQENEKETKTAKGFLWSRSMTPPEHIDRRKSKYRK